MLGGTIGYVIGDTRSFGYRLQAQSALCQLRSERNTAILAEAVVTRMATPTPAPAPRQAQTVPQPPAVQQQLQTPAPQAPEPQPAAAPEEQPAAPQPLLTPPVSASRVA